MKDDTTSLFQRLLGALRPGAGANLNVFLSYSRSDQSATVALAEQLKRLGCKVWFDQQIIGGQQWWQAILDHIRTADLFIFVLSAESLVSPACALEYEYGAKTRKRILPVLVADDVDIRLLPPSLQQIQVVDVRRQDDAAWQTLAQALQHLPPASPPLALPVAAPPVPISPLGQLRAQVQGAPLDFAHQAALVLQLKSLLADPKTATPTRELLNELRGKPWLLASVATEIATLLAPAGNSTGTAPTVGSDDIAMSLDLMPPAYHNTADVPPDQMLLYEAQVRDGMLDITPHLPYLDALRVGAPMPALASGFTWEFPRLDVKLVNNAPRTLFFTEAILRVQASEPIRDPVVVAHIDQGRSNALHLLLVNEGWADITGGDVHFNVLPAPDHALMRGVPRTPPTIGASFVHALSLPPMTEGKEHNQVNLDLSTALRAEGVFTHGLEQVDIVKGRKPVTRGSDGPEYSLRSADGRDVQVPERALDDWRGRCYGPFINGAALVAGEVRYTTAAGARGLSRFYTIVYLSNGYLGGAAVMPSYQYEAELPVDQHDYAVCIPIAHALKTGEADRFTIRLGAAQSALHHMLLELHYNGGYVTSAPIMLHMFVPRAGKRQQISPSPRH